MTKRRNGSKGSDSIKGDYDVGYGRPPRQHRFKPGQSGNPKGRRRGSRSFTTLLIEELGKQITIRENGIPRRITKMQAAVTQFVNKAMLGDHRALKVLLGYVPLPEDKDDPAKQAEISASFKAFVETLDRLTKIKGVAGGN